MRALHTGIGKTVPVRVLDPNDDSPLGSLVQARVVGVVATPQFFFSQVAAGNAAVMSEDFLIAQRVPQGVLDAALFVRFAPGVSLAHGLARLKALGPALAFLLPRTQSSDLGNLQQISNLPSVLAGLLGFVAVGTLIHTLVSSVRRRRRDLAVLRALGFVRSQVGLTIVWQATTIVVIALAVGLPLGVVAARLGWRAFVDQLGYVPDPVIPLLAVLLIVPVAILLSNLIASIPARAAARMRPAEALRAE